MFQHQKTDVELRMTVLNQSRKKAKGLQKYHQSHVLIPVTVLKLSSILNPQ